MTFDKFNRRIHLYSALVLVPWFLIYGFSAIYFTRPIGHAPKWTVRIDREYHLGPIAPDADLDKIGARIMRDNGLKGPCGAFRNEEGGLNLWCPGFITPSNVTYSPATNRVQVTDRNFDLQHALVEMHVRGGFEIGGFLHHLWAVVVDVVGFATVVWVVSGIYMWWNLKRSRLWGSVAIGAGLAAFLGFLLAL